MSAGVTGWGTALPDRVLDNAELAAKLGISEDWILERTGIHSRRIAGESDSAASLAVRAGRAALERAGRAPDDLDMVIVATSTPNHQLPATASLVQNELGARNAGAFDLNAACAGFLVALAQASALVDSGMSESVLVCGADLLSRVLDYTDKGSCILFGDGAGAVLVEKSGDTRLGPFKIYSDGSKADLLRVPTGEPYMRMKGREVYRHAVAGMTAAVRDILSAAGMSVDDIDLLVAHQANARIIEAVAARLGLRAEQAMININRLGNTSAASIPLALAEAVDEGRLKQDDLVVVTAFGAGFVWGAGIVRWGAMMKSDQDLVTAGGARV